MSRYRRSLDTVAKRVGFEGSRRACWSLLIVVSMLGCKPEITRISDGSTRLERPIAPEAYAAFGRARLLELQGDTRDAIAAYLEVLAYDPEAAEAYVRVGTLSCDTDPAGAVRAFDAAERRNPDSAELHRAKARCALIHRRSQEAARAAARALRLAPDRESSLLLIEAHRATGQAHGAERIAWAHVAMFPDDSRGWMTLADLVDPRSPIAAQLIHRATRRVPTGITYIPRASERASERASAPGHRPAEVVRDGRVTRSTTALATPLDVKPAAKLDLDMAFAKGDVRAIHRAARVLGLNTLELVQRAMAAGALEFARAQATIAGQVNPDDFEIWQLRLRLADLLGDDTEFDALLDRPPAPPSRPASQTDLSVLYGVIEDRTGVDAKTIAAPSD